MGSDPHPTARAAALATALAVLAFAALRCTSFEADDNGGSDAGEAGTGLTPSCDGDHCDCDGDPSNGRETAVLADDRNNCGACKRSCLAVPPLGDQTCKSGVCVGLPIASAQKLPTALVAHGDDVAWGTDDGRVFTAKPSDWTPVQAMPMFDKPIDSLAIDDEFLYVVANYLPNNDGRLVRVPRIGSCGTTCEELKATPGGGVSRVLLAGGTLFFVFTASGSNPDDLRSAAPNGFAAGGTTLHSAPFLGALAVGGGFLHAREYGQGGQGKDRLLVRPIGACPASMPTCTITLVDGAVVTGMDADADAVFFADGNTHVLGRKQRSGAASVEPIVPALRTPGAVVLDGNDLYFTDSDPAPTDGGAVTGRVLRIGKDGKCANYAPCPQVLATGVPAGVTSIAVGKTMVFFATGGNAGSVLRTPK